MKKLVLVHGDALPDGSAIEMLKAQGYEVTIPSESEAAVEAVVDDRPSALIYILPPSPAHDLAILRLVRRAAPNVPLILLAAEGSLEIQRESLQLRPVYYAVFPIDSEELLGAVEAALRGPHRHPASVMRSRAAKPA